MIVPMKKVSLMIMGDKKKETLKKLRKLGILHIEITEGSGKKLEELKEQISLIESAIFSVSEKKNKNIEIKEDGTCGTLIHYKIDDYAKERLKEKRKDRKEARLLRKEAFNEQYEENTP